MYFTSGFVEKYDGNGLKTMTKWQKNLSNSACASRGFVGLQIKRDGGDLKNTKQLSFKCSKSTKTKAKHTDLRNIRLICLFRQVFG